jgi:hypothetical protein
MGQNRTDETTERHIRRPALADVAVLAVSAALLIGVLILGLSGVFSR